MCLLACKNTLCFNISCDNRTKSLLSSRVLEICTTGLRWWWVLSRVFKTFDQYQSICCVSWSLFLCASPVVSVWKVSVLSRTMGGFSPHNGCNTSFTHKFFSSIVKDQSSTCTPYPFSGEIHTFKFGQNLQNIGAVKMKELLLKWCSNFGVKIQCKLICGDFCTTKHIRIYIVFLTIFTEIVAIYYTVISDLRHKMLKYIPVCIYNHKLSVEFYVLLIMSAC